MFCENCGKQVPENGVCGCAQAAQSQPQQPQPQQQPQQPYQAPAQSDNRKTYSYLSYIGILWLIGMFAAPEKEDPGVRFHVGQGILISIVMVAFNVFGGVIRYFTPDGLWGLVNFCIWAAPLALAIIGLVNVNKGQQKPLPVIGGLAFYK